MSDQKKLEENLKINKPADWLAIQENWLKTRIDVLQAHADAYFISDEELPASRHILLISIATFFFLFIVWASLARIDQVTRGEGKIIPTAKIQVIQSLEGGIIDKFFVRESQAVKKGETLIQLRNIDASSDLGSNEARYLGLKATITRLQAESEGKETVEFDQEIMKKVPQSVTEELNAFRANREKIFGQRMVLDQQLAQRRQEVNELEQKAADINREISLSQQEKNMIAPLVAKGSAPKIELIQLERGIQERRTELNGVRQAIPRANSAISEAQARLSELITSAQAQAQMELSSKLTEMNTIKETLSALTDRKDRTEIKSPVNGTVKDMRFMTVGGVVKPGDPIMEIVPMDDQLLIEARVRPSDIAFLHPGQNAVVKITAYDYSIYGGLKGKVVEISADSIQNEKGESFYRVKVRTEQNMLKRKGEVLPIIPGMVATVDIMTGQRTIMQYILKPFIRTMTTSMGER